MRAMILGLAFVVALATEAAASPRYVLDARQAAVVRISGLAGPGLCVPGHMRGKVVKNVFDPRGIKLTGLTIEAPDGARSLVNVEVPEDLPMVDLAWITRGLQTLGKTGRRVSLDVQLCGAAGRVMMLDGIR